MGRRFTFLIGLAAILVLIADPAVPAEAPAKMIHVIVQMNGTGIAEGTFAAKPKTIWRASNRYCRVDEEPDPANGIHGNLVINEPDAWLVNLVDNTAKHVLDTGPTLNCKLPIFAMNPEMAKGKIGELEIGHELEFFQANGAKRIDGPKLQFAANYYELQVGDVSLRLVERVDVHAPILIGYLRGDKAYQARYLLWEEVPFKADLFAQPTGVTIKEAK